MNITAPHNLDLYNNATTLFQMAAASNTIVGEILGIVILVLGFLVPLIVLRNYETKYIFVVSSSVSTILGILLLTPLEWITLDIFWYPLIMLIVSVIYALFSKD